MPLGRPPIFDETLKAKFCGMLVMGCSRTSAAKYVGVSPQTVRRHLEEDEVFVEQVRQAEIDCELDALRDLLAASKKSWRSAAYRLRCINGDRWDPRRSSARRRNPKYDSPDDLNTFELPTLEDFAARAIVQANRDRVEEFHRNTPPGHFAVFTDELPDPLHPDAPPRARWEYRPLPPKPQPAEEQPAVPVPASESGCQATSNSLQASTVIGDPKVPDARESTDRSLADVPAAPPPNGPQADRLTEAGLPESGCQATPSSFQASTSASDPTVPDAPESTDRSLADVPAAEPLVSGFAGEPSVAAAVPTAPPPSGPRADRLTEVTPPEGATYGAQPRAQTLDVPRETPIEISANAP